MTADGEGDLYFLGAGGALSNTPSIGRTESRGGDIGEERAIGDSKDRFMFLVGRRFFGFLGGFVGTEKQRLNFCREGEVWRIGDAPSSWRVLAVTTPRMLIL